MLARIKQTDLSVPTRRGEYLYYTRTEEGKQYPIQCRRKGTMKAPEEVLLDLNELAKGKAYAGLGAFVVSDDQNLLAYTIDYTGFRQYTLQVKDLRDGHTLPDHTERVTSVSWAADNKTLFLTTEDAVTKRSDKLWRHTLGSSRFEPLYDEKDELFDIEIARTRDKSYLVLEIEATDTSEVRYLRADRPEAWSFAVLLPREKKHRYYLDHREGASSTSAPINPASDFAIVTALSDNDPGLRRTGRSSSLIKTAYALKTSISSRTSRSPSRRRRRSTVCAFTTSKRGPGLILHFRSPSIPRSRPGRRTMKRANTGTTIRASSRRRASSITILRPASPFC